MGEHNTNERYGPAVQNLEVTPLQRTSMNKILYPNGRRGRLQADMGLQLGADMQAGVVAIAKALADQEKWNYHRTYD